MAERSAHESELIAKAGRYLAGGTLGNLSEDVILASGRGSRVWDASGREYVDYLLGSGPMLVGHAHPEVVAAVRAQLERGSTFFATNEQAILLAEEISKAMPCAEKVRFCSTGTEATLYAMRVARAFRRRDRILKFEGGYHGMHDYALMSMAPAAPLPFPQPVPDSAGIPRAIESTMLIAPFNDLETTAALIDRHRDELAGVIVEPFQRVLPPRPGFLAGLRELTARHGIPLIFDEVVTSFRLAYGGAQEYYGVTPDLCALGKAVGGGFPLTAVAGRDELMAHFDATRVGREQFLPQIGTLSGNPVATAAGLATVRILKRPGTYERMHALGNRLKAALQQACDRAGVPARVVGEGVLFEVYFTDGEIVDYRSTLRADRQRLVRFVRLLREHGVFRGTSKFYLSIAHDETDFAITARAFEAAAAAAAG
ncbi:MAG TPA: aminotransferase class III-fold pyridoxal phosphate-dependent enzyme [Methylomirabilota bacterium]|jgi:glutamate-1-semialdehyde 2,1-aminomutase|nr:aminotransferase class III-fold pyridoxal phosphate-dependent enzyme [Methylomirabilota bacterium]